MSNITAPEPLVQAHRPAEFVDLKAYVPSLYIDLKYAGTDNFLGRPVEGYVQGKHSLTPWLTQAAAEAVAEVQVALSEFGLSLLVFDTYRPQRAVNDFIAWSSVVGDESKKATYYPNLPKSALFGDGYLIKHSSHSRGSTLDVTLVDAVTGEALDMGTCFDFFGPESWLDAMDISPQARANRMLLQAVMVAQGFVPFDKEWWHFTLANEPFPNQYFDFVE